MLFFDILAGSLAFDNRISDLADQQLDGADGVVIGGDHVIDVARVAVGIHQGDDRDIEQVGFMDGSDLTAHIHHEKKFGDAGHHANAA